MITASAINALPRDMRSALADLLGHGELLFAAGFFIVPGGTRYRGATIWALKGKGLVTLSSLRPRHAVAKLSAAGRPIVRAAMGQEADALAAQ